MTMTWKDVAHAVADFAPTAGSLLGGPAGGAVGALIAATLGTATEPDKVVEAIQSDPQAAVKLKELELNHRLEMERLVVQAEANRLARETAELQEETKQAQTVNETMQEEVRNADKEAWYQKGWRPFNGFAVGAAFFISVVCILWLAYVAVSEKDTTAMAMIPQLVTALAMLFTLAYAVLGVAAHHRGKVKRITAGESGAGLLGALADRFKNKKEKAG